MAQNLGDFDTFDYESPTTPNHLIEEEDDFVDEDPTEREVTAYRDDNGDIFIYHKDEWPMELDRESDYL